MTWISLWRKQNDSFLWALQWSIVITHWSSKSFSCWVRCWHFCLSLLGNPAVKFGYLWLLFILGSLLLIVLKFCVTVMTMTVVFPWLVVMGSVKAIVVRLFWTHPPTGRGGSRSQRREKVRMSERGRSHFVPFGFPQCDWLQGRTQTTFVFKEMGVWSRLVVVATYKPESQVHMWNSRRSVFLKEPLSDSFGLA